MVTKSLGALIFRNVEMATQVLESDDVVDRYRDRIFKHLLQHMTKGSTLVSPGLQFILATRHLERIADHATNIAEDIIFWVRWSRRSPRPWLHGPPRAGWPGRSVFCRGFSHHGKFTWP